MKPRDWFKISIAAALVLAAAAAVAGSSSDRLSRKGKAPRTVADPSYGAGLSAHRFAVSVATLRQWLAGANPPQVIDIRHASVYAAAHISGAINRPSADLLASEVGSIAAGQVVIYDQDGRLAPYLVHPLRASGVDVYTLTGGHVAWVGPGRARTPAAGSANEHEPPPRAPTVTSPPPAATPPPAAAPAAPAGKAAPDAEEGC